MDQQELRIKHLLIGIIINLVLWQTQLNFVVFCACGTSVEHMNAKIRSIYRFHVYYHIRRILERLKKHTYIKPRDIKWVYQFGYQKVRDGL